VRSTSQLQYLPATAKIFFIATLSFALTMTSASALNLATPASLDVRTALQAPGDLIEVRAVAHRGGAARGPRGGAVVHRGGAAVGPRGGVAHRGTAVVGPRGNVAVRSTTVAGRGGGWARPGWYRWGPGGAIAAGAAIGFVSAATAAAWAGPAPAAGMCWYYTDPSRTQGFWDYCQ
jgi:hypothetical protein